ncbi:MAG: GNAT superfamily N-acetyltransferase [Planctomycetota bacterium]|jgi:GNAT superfamily N-acetyltransferase
MTSAESNTEQSFEVVLCGPADRAEQARLFNACFKKTLEPSALDWRYDQNPHGTAVSLLARPSGQDGVCGYACSPRLALCRGDERTMAPIGQTGDVMTHPEWRKQGIFRGLDKRAMEETAKLRWPLVFGLPNRRSAHIFVQMGWRQVGLIRPWNFVMSVSAESKAIRRVDGRLAAFRTSSAYKKGRAARRELRGLSEGLFGVRRIARFDKEVTELSKAVEPSFDLMVRRDAEYLNWRFIENTAKMHTPLGIYTVDGKLAAYVIIQAPRDGEVVGYLVDVLAKDKAALAQAMEAGLAHLQAAGAELVQSSCVDGGWWEARLKEAGFQKPKADNHLIVIAYLHKDMHRLSKAAVDASRWYLTDGDRDDETMG